MAQFRLPRVPDPNESVRRFVSTALAARENDQNESFQMQQSLVQMEAQQKRKEMLQKAFKSSTDRIKSVYAKPSDEFNREIENEAMQYDMSAPEIATTLRRNKRSEPKVIERELLDESGNTVKRLEKYDEFHKTSTEIPGTSRITNKNSKFVQGETEKGDKTEESLIEVQNGKVVSTTKIGEKTSEPKEKKSVYDSSAYRQYEVNRDKAHNKALEAEVILAGIDAALKAYTVDSKEDAKAIFKYSDGKGTDIATADEAKVLRDRIIEQVKAFNKQGADWQTKIDLMEQSEAKNETKSVSKEKVRVYDPKTKSLIDQINDLKPKK